MFMYEPHMIVSASIGIGAEMMKYKASENEAKYNLKKLLISVIISEGVGFVASLLTIKSHENYMMLENPAFAPPPGVVGPIWIVLYFLMGWAAYRVLMKHSKQEVVKDALFYYGAQLVFNFLWPILFFRYYLIGVAFLDIIVLLIFVIITTVKFFRIDKLAGQLMLPYIVWVAYTTILNYSLMKLNM